MAAVCDACAVVVVATVVVWVAEVPAVPGEVEPPPLAKVIAPCAVDPAMVSNDRAATAKRRWSLGCAVT
jgi:hypothetical protein